MKTRYWCSALAVVAACLLAACDGVTDEPAPYEGARPLALLRITQSFTPDVQWVGGRVAAVGVNRGDRAALDSTLVWLQTADGNEISSHVTVGTGTAADLVRQFGGVPVDSLSDGESYTFWLAERDAFDGQLDPASLTAFNFVDTTVAMNLVLRGNVRGGVTVTFSLTKEERLLGTRYILDWAPRTKAFRQIGLLKGGATPSFNGLLWHVAQPAGTPDGILPPVVIGDTLDVADTAIGLPGFAVFPETPEEADSYVLWMTDSAWNQQFAIRSPGLAYFVILRSNFE